MTVYLNWKGPQGRETVDEFTKEPGQTWLEFTDYVREMISNYRECGMNVYRSSRCCRDWNED